jgi:hypothetical protein
MLAYALIQEYYALHLRLSTIIKMCSLVFLNFLFTLHLAALVIALHFLQTTSYLRPWQRPRVDG